MSDSKHVLVFGSFTEDETLSWKQRQSSQSVPAEKTEMQFGSLNFGSGKPLAVPNGDSTKQPIPENGVLGSQSTNSIKKDDGVKSVKATKNHLPKALPKKNGSVASSTHRSVLSNGAKESKTESIDLTSLYIAQKEVAPQSQSTTFNFQLLDKNSNENGVADDFPSLGSSGNTHKASVGTPTTCTNLLPRGLINSGNLCFLNSTLQALLSCSPFVQLLQEFRTRDIPKAGYPTLTAFIEFVSNFDMPAGLSSSSKKKDTVFIDTGRPFSPVMFEGVLKSFTPDVPSSISGRPSQEDAQEFLSFIMDQMHDELLKLEGQCSKVNGSKSSLVSSEEEDDWETVGPKNKSAVTRTSSLVPSKLSDIFGGELKSEVKARGNRPSATVQPFLLLHLDIKPDAVRTIEDALRLFSAPETVEGYRTSATGNAGLVTAKKSVKIQKLSKIMILHLIRFDYGSQGSTKLNKPVYFPLEFVLGRELLVSTSTEGRKYELVATVTHHGRESSKGHYSADCRCPNGQWVRYDDSSVTAIGINKVLHEQAYVLFYKQV